MVPAGEDHAIKIIIIVFNNQVRMKQIKALQRYLCNSKKDFDPEDPIAGVLERIAQDIVTYAVQRGSSDDCTAIVTAISVEKEKKVAAPAQ